ncbi:MAG: NAD(P)H-hydrate dehydratase [Betaproteobacteria bacterium]|nr:NAD(P)H-hydrate dehydratase [Betaproteobacteria bacterium]
MTAAVPIDIRPDTLLGWLEARPADSHKGDFGSVGVVGGAPGMAGAALLAARAALWLGAGRVYAGLLDGRIALDPMVPELMVVAPERALDLAPPACLVLGPGLGHSGTARQCLADALRGALPLLVDADGLNLLAKDAELQALLRQRQAPSLLTPHPGEAGRLLGLDSQAVQTDRIDCAQRLAERFGCNIVLKGASSLIATPAGGLWRNTTGNPGLASAGMGDVLAGMIAALVAQGLSLAQAAVYGVHLHGAAADRLVADGAGPVGLTASEVARAARELLNERLKPA